MAYNIHLPRRIQREENRVQPKHTRERESERERGLRTKEEALHAQLSAVLQERSDLSS
jgi:hypothetical protein